MNPDSLALLGLALGVVVLLGVALARRTGLPDPVVLVGVGLAASFLPGAPTADLPPDLVFLVFLPPLVYRASFLTSPQTLRANAGALALLAVGLVVATAVAVALVVSWLVPGIGLAGGLVLGAVVAPTDPVASAGVFSRLGAPKRVVDLVESESLINDATALVLYAIAVEAVVSGPPSAVSALGQLALAVLGGLAIGAGVAWVVARLRRRVSDVGLQLLLSLLTPYVSYVLADHIGASGVLAVVATGVLLGARAEGVFGAEARLQSRAFWSLLDLLLNAVLFVLLGLEVRRVLAGTPRIGTGRLLLYAAAVVAVVVVVRVLWQFVVPPLAYLVRERLGSTSTRSSHAERLVLGWTGMRGAISLAAALALPLEAGDHPFPERALIIFLTVSVVLSTLVVQGLTLPLLLARLGLAGDGHEANDQAEQQTRLALADIALARLDELEGAGEVTPADVAPLRQIWEQARRRATPEDNGTEGEVDLVWLRLELTRAQSEELERRRSQGEVPAEVVRLLRQELDLQQVRLSSPGRAGTVT